MSAPQPAAADSSRDALVRRILQARAPHDSSASEFQCITARGAHVTITAKDIEPVSYLHTLFHGSEDSGAAPCERDDNGLYKLPAELEQPCLGVVLAYSAQRWKDTPYSPKLLMTTLSVRADFAAVLALLRFLSIAAPALPAATARSTQLEELRSTLEDVNDDWEYGEGSNSRSRDAAVTLCVALAEGRLDLQDAKVRTHLFKCFECILNTPRTFRRRLRFHAYTQLRAHCPPDMFSSEKWEQLQEWKDEYYSDSPRSPRDPDSESDHSNSDSESEDERSERWANTLFYGTYYSDDD